MATASTGIKLFAVHHLQRGGRQYMEDFVHVQLGEEAFVGVFDGHGGQEAAVYAKAHLWANIQAEPGFGAENSKEVKEAIVQGFLRTQRDMRTVRGTWRPTRHGGSPSTAGSTASIAIFRQPNMMYPAHVGDSTIVLGMEAHTSKSESALKALSLSNDHKPADPTERHRIKSIGGQVVESAKGEGRVVWEREGGALHPLVNVARSLGDLWSYKEEHASYLVSPVPDVRKYEVNPKQDRFLIVASDGLWAVFEAQEAVDYVQSVHQEEIAKGRWEENPMLVAKAVTREALRRWQQKKKKADNISVAIVFFEELDSEPPEPPTPNAKRVKSCSDS